MEKEVECLHGTLENGLLWLTTCEVVRTFIMVTATALPQEEHSQWFGHERKLGKTMEHVSVHKWMYRFRTYVSLMGLWAVRRKAWIGREVVNDAHLRDDRTNRRVSFLSD